MKNEKQYTKRYVPHNEPMKQINGYFENAIDSVETFEILVMDFTIGETFLYDITQEETYETEQFLEGKKHNSSNCQWMIANKIIINDLKKYSEELI